MTATVQKQVLINAEPGRWTKGALACTADGQRVAWYDPFAVKWCAQGAIYRAAFDLVGDSKEATRIGNEVARSVCPTPWFRGALPAINDARGHTAVLAVFDKALQAA